AELQARNEPHPCGIPLPLAPPCGMRGCSSSHPFRRLAAPRDEGFDFGHVPATERAELVALRDLAGVGEPENRSPRTPEHPAGFLGVNEPSGKRLRGTPRSPIRCLSFWLSN